MNKFVLSGLLLFMSILLFAENKISDADDSLKQFLNKEYFKVNVLIQAEGRYSFEDDDFQGGRTFRVANARVSIKGVLENGFFYRVYFNTAPSPKLLDAFVGYKFSEGLSLSLGAMKPKQTLDYIPNPAAHNFVDRTEMTALLVGSRELGVAATGNLGDFYYYAGLFNGSRMNANNNNKFYGIGRVQYTVTKDLPGYVKVGLHGSHGNSAGIVSGSRGLC
jgi:phosphate-selective porin